MDSYSSTGPTLEASSLGHCGSGIKKTEVILLRRELIYIPVCQHLDPKTTRRARACVTPVSVWVSIWRKHFSAVSMSVSTMKQHSHKEDLRGSARSRRAGGRYQPHGRVQGDAFRVVEILVQQRDAGQAVLVADKHPIVHIIHKVKVLGQPVDGHLFHI